MKGILHKLISNRFYTYLAIFTIAVFGSIAYNNMGVDFFPDAERPTVVVMFNSPGLSATDLERDISRPVERACYSIDSVRRVSSINRDGMAIISVEFQYSKDPDTALLEVSNVLNRVQLPEGTATPVVFKTGDFTRPVMTLAVRSKDDALPLSMARQLADNELRDRLLSIKNVSSVEVFGGERRELRVEVSVNRMLQHHILLSDIVRALKTNNLSLPAGLHINGDSSILIRLNTEAELVSGIGDIPVVGRSGPVPLREIADIQVTTTDKNSSFFFNNEKAVAVNILRNQDANTLETILEVKKALPAIKQAFPSLDIQIADSQERIITLSISNLSSSLLAAVALTVVVLFFVIGELRISLLVAISLPLTFLLSFIAMWALDMRFNIITMSAVIISSGMLVDNNIVVSENIQRHLATGQRSMLEAITEATSEVMVSIFSGTVSTILVLVPVMFLGGYVQKILQPLALTLTITLVSSYIVAIWFVPVLFPWVSEVAGRLGVLERGASRLAMLSQKYLVGSIRDFFAAFFLVVNRHRVLVIPVLVLLPLSMILMDRLVGRDLMPPMDTGIIMIDAKVSPEFSAEHTEEVLEEINSKVLSKYRDITLSSLEYIGSEPGLISFGRGRTPGDIAITLTLTDRFHREKDIWQIEDEIRQGLYRIDAISVASVREYGATPLSSIAAPVDIQIEGDDLDLLDTLARKLEHELGGMAGFTSVSRNWYMDKKEYRLRFNSRKAAYYGITPVDVSYYLSRLLGGTSGGRFRIEGQDGLNIRVTGTQHLRGDINNIETLSVPTRRGYVPLRELAEIEHAFVPQIYSRDSLHRTVHVYGYKATAPITFLDRQRNWVVERADIPPGVTISKMGELRQMNESFGRLGQALVFSVIFLFIAFVLIFRSFSDSLIIMLAIPLSFIGAVWGLLIAGKHGCMPAFMGFILLIGVIVNNSILLVDFVKRFRHRYNDINEAVYEAVRVRTRPVVATALTTIAGMLPIAAERAFGLERLSPLAIVAIGGLFIGTFLTLVYTPVFYLMKEWLVEKLRGAGIRKVISHTVDTED